MRRIALPSWLPLDPFVLTLLAVVGLAALLPASGTAETVVSDASKVAIGLLFFLYGARLSTREALDGLRAWRLHLFVIASTFVLFPLLGLAARGLVPWLLTEQLYTGFLFLCLVPSTIQSSIAFTSIARGNVPAAICAGTYSALLGMVLTPLLVAWFIGSKADFSTDGLLGIGTQLLLPFIAGQVLRRWIGGFVKRNRRVLGYVDRSSILLVVYTAFSEGMNQGIWSQVTPLRLLALAGVLGVLLAVVLLITSTLSRRMGFSREDRVAIVFAGSKKSLANGLPMAAVLFGSAASITILPLMLFHQLQLIVCAVIAKRWARTAPDVGAVARGDRASRSSSSAGRA
ncbi:bile acid:sodium symporter [Streptomyces sp. A7024]|uniref:Bile acid:sodium symporter n=1 Tax=Streptomyces coryli TaxID=1128680 RepID=A0A6G4TY59_9ACTN|nr:bile acid:sodium symporter family protein [Streptomyces coryli]NGN64939.1 bile acid:sodium symporter [Streptomyces coryli]